MISGFFVNTQDGRVATQGQLTEAGLLASLAAALGCRSNPSIAVTLERQPAGSAGGTIAAPIAKSVLEAMLGGGL